MTSKTSMTCPTRALAPLFAAAALLVIGPGCARVSGPYAADHAEQQFREGLAEERRGDLGEAADCFEDALDYDPEHALALRGLGRVRAQAGRHDEAVRLLERSIRASVEAEASPAEAYGDLAHCHEAKGDLEEAEAAYRRGVKSAPNSARLRTGYGMLLARQGRADEAFKHLRVAMPDAEARQRIAGAAAVATHERRADAR